MDHLPEDCGKIGGDGAAQLSGEALPEVAWLDGHASSLSPTSVTTSWMASRVSLVAAFRRIGCRLVAGREILNTMRSR
jgi:hypothetical protein